MAIAAAASGLLLQKRDRILERHVAWGDGGGVLQWPTERAIGDYADPQVIITSDANEVTVEPEAITEAEPDSCELNAMKYELL
ncbi:hypothetical protein ACLOJK_008969 [Asimina triloba]